MLQVGPLKPSAQTHSNAMLNTTGVQVPPFWQGSDRQGSGVAEQIKKVKNKCLQKDEGLIR